MISPVIIHNSTLRREIIHPRSLFRTAFTLRRRCTSRTAQSVFLENHAEQPVIAINKYDSVDIIGPPDTISNLRPIIRRNLNETALQKKLREMQNTTQQWNQDFWSDHNTKFAKERQKYIELHLKDDGESQLSAEEMSEFYKKFLDENWQTHVQYNFKWYQKNFTLLLLALQVSIEKLARKVS